MAWYENGIQGTYAYPTSTGLSAPLSYMGNNDLNVSNPVIIESFAADTHKLNGDTYSVVLNSFSTGTTLGIDITVTQHRVDWFSTMLPYATTYINQTFSFYIKNGDTKYTIGSNGINYLTNYYSGGNAPGGMEFSIYGYEYIRANGNPMQSPTFCIPYGGVDAGSNTSFLLIYNSGYLE